MRHSLNYAARACLVFAGSLYGLAASHSVLAQLVLEEVIVTAQKKEENLLETPVAVTSLGEDDLRELGITKTTGLAETIPNVTMTSLGGSPNSSGTFIRGLGTLDPQVTSDVKVGTYIDGAYLARMNNAALELADVQRVEVLRGPQGTLYGRNTTGGAINVISRQPLGEFGYTLDGSVGKFGYWRALARVDTPEASGWSAAFTYLATNHDGYIDNLSTRPEARDKAGADDTDAWRVALRWEPTDIFSALLSYTSIEATKTGIGIQLSAAGFRVNPTTVIPLAGLQANASQDRLGAIAMDFLEDDDSESVMTNLTLTWDVGDLTVKSITATSEWDHQGINDQDGGEYFTPVGAIGTGGANCIAVNGLLATAGARTSCNLAWNDEGSDQFTQELQLLGVAFDERLDFILGLFYFQEEAEADSFARTGVLDVTTPTFRRVETDYSSQAAFGQVTFTPYALDQRLSLTGGLRYTRDDKKADQRIAAPANNARSQVDLALSGEGDWDNVSWTAVVNYAIGEATNLYAKASTGYNSGSFNIRDTGFNPATGTPDFETPFDEETLLSYELGLKSELWDGRARASLAAFYTEFDDMQLNVVPPRSECLGGLFCSRTENAGKAELSGIEFEFQALLGEGLVFSGSYGYIDAEVKEYVDSRGMDRADTAVFALTPEHNASLGLSYEFPPTGIGVFSLRLDGSYRDEVFFIGNTNNADLYGGDDYVLLHGRLTLSDIPVAEGDLQVSLWGRNLADEEYRAMGIDFTLYQNNTYGPPLSYGVDVRYLY